LIHTTPQTGAFETILHPAGPAASAAGIGLPDFATRPAPAEPAPPRPLIATRPSQPEPPPRSPLGGDALDRQRFQRGLLIHRLMQSLPGIPAPEAEAAARRFLARSAHLLTPETQDEILRETLAVLFHPEFTPLFGPGSRAEVPVTGLIDGKALSARIDRLVVTRDEVLILDYKTNRPPPEDAGSVAQAYRDQLAAYRRAHERIYPDRRVRTLLLWTDGPRLMEIPAA
jgi:ATP-dependent helicase/nuclease subunit A